MAGNSQSLTTKVLTRQAPEEENSTARQSTRRNGPVTPPGTDVDSDATPGQEAEGADSEGGLPSYGQDGQGLQHQEVVYAETDKTGQLMNGCEAVQQHGSFAGNGIFGEDTTGMNQHQSAVTCDGNSQTESLMEQHIEMVDQHGHGNPSKKDEKAVVALDHTSVTSLACENENEPLTGNGSVKDEQKIVDGRVGDVEVERSASLDQNSGGGHNHLPDRNFIDKCSNHPDDRRTVETTLKMTSTKVSFTTDNVRDRNVAFSEDGYSSETGTVRQGRCSTVSKGDEGQFTDGTGDHAQQLQNGKCGSTMSNEDQGNATSLTVGHREKVIVQNSEDRRGAVSSSTTHETARSERLKVKSAGLCLDLVANVKTESTVRETEEPLVEGPDVIASIREWLGALQGMETFSNKRALEILKAIANSHWQHPEKREEIASAVNAAGGAEILLNILLSLGREGLFKRNSIWYPANYCYNIVWNLSDGGSELAASLGSCGMVGLCSANIAHGPYLENMHKKNVLFLLKASLSILHNISRVESIKHKFREVDLVQKMLPYTGKNQKYLKALCMLILANIVDEDQESLLDEKGTIEFLIQLLKEAQSSEDRRAQGLSCSELANGLGRLAVHDANKVKIQAANGLPPFINMLDSSDISEQEAATQALWSLSFDPSICKLLSTNEKALTSLRALQSCGNQAVEMSAKGTLWMLRHLRKSIEEECSVDGKKKVRPKSSRQSSLRRIHVMISYQWSSQKTVLRIRDDLVAAGYIVWVDVDKMCGSTLQAMAEAVERAAAVIICMSEGYKMSPNCRTEAEYAYQLQKWIIPLMMDMYYEPDGWLGLILGAKYYMDFSGAVPYDESAQKLIRELDTSKSSFDAPDSVFDEVEAVITKSTAATCGSSAGPMNWSEEDVQTWLANHNLQKYKDAFEGCTGKLLLQLRSLRLEAPEFFYRSLKEDLGIAGIFNILRFTEALEDIR